MEKDSKAIFLSILIWIVNLSVLLIVDQLQSEYERLVEEKCHKWMEEYASFETHVPDRMIEMKKIIHDLHKHRTVMNYLKQDGAQAFSSQYMDQVLLYAEKNLNKKRSNHPILDHFFIELSEYCQEQPLRFSISSDNMADCHVDGFLLYQLLCQTVEVLLKRPIISDSMLVVNARMTSRLLLFRFEYVYKEQNHRSRLYHKLLERQTTRQLDKITEVEGTLLVQSNNRSVEVLFTIPRKEKTKQCYGKVRAVNEYSSY